MKKTTLHSAIGLSIAFMATGCSVLELSDRDQHYNNSMTSVISNDPNCGPGANIPVSQYYINESGKQSQSVKIRVTGYGARPKSFYPDPQRRLMAMRAAKVDAYRNLAERISGIQIWGGSTIGDMVVEQDRFRVYLDTHLAGARVIGENSQEDGTFETIVELRVGQDFLNNALPSKVSDNCNGVKQPKFRSASAPPMDAPDDDNYILSNFNFSRR